MARAARKPFLDLMDGGDAVHQRSGAFCHRAAAGRHPVGLLARDIALELSDVTALGGSNMVAYTTHERHRCRSLLEELIAPIARGQAKNWASLLLAHFRNLPTLLAADSRAVRKIIPDERLPRFLSAIDETLRHSLQINMSAEPLLETSDALINYLSLTMAHRATETVRILFLNSANRLISDEEFASGTVSSVFLHARDVLKRALEIDSTALIVVHNHPSGNPQPSQQDIIITRQFANAARLLDITLHDHIVIASEGWCSMRKLGVME